jgi:hypothetical protein
VFSGISLITAGTHRSSSRSRAGRNGRAGAQRRRWVAGGMAFSLRVNGVSGLGLDNEHVYSDDERRVKEKAYLFYIPYLIDVTIVLF